MKVVSFDIFDTALIRKCGKPENVFWIMAKKLFPGDKNRQCKFVLWRETAGEQISRKDRNYTLEELYRTASADSDYYAVGENGASLCELEYAVESDMLAANPIISDKIYRCRSRGNKILFISDMYMNSSFLRSILVREDLFVEGDMIYVSCEHKARKDDGSLFKLIREEIGPTMWNHYGDNPHSDVIIPKKQGIKAHQVNFDYSNAETQFSGLFLSGIYDNADMPVLMGYMRYLRLTGSHKPEDFFAINYIAPLYYAYVKHVLDEASARGLKTLFFLSRDSYILMKIAELIPHDGLYLKYLYVSRKSIQPAFRYISTETDIKAAIGLNVISSGRHDSDKESYELLDAYFAQEGVYDENIGLVDLGWYGSTRMMINKLRSSRGGGPCFCYYLGVVKNSLPELFGKYDAFMYSDSFASRFHTFIIEEYFSLTFHPTTIGYREESGLISPVFGGEPSNHTGYVNVNIDNCIRFAREMIQIDDSVISLYSINSIFSIDNGLDREYINLLFNVCRNEDFQFRRLTFKDMYSYVRGLQITLNDKLALDASFGKTTRAALNALRRIIDILKSFKSRLRLGI